MKRCDLIEEGGNPHLQIPLSLPDDVPLWGQCLEEEESIGSSGVSARSEEVWPSALEDEGDYGGHNTMVGVTSEDGMEGKKQKVDREGSTLAR